MKTKAFLHSRIHAYLLVLLLMCFFSTPATASPTSVIETTDLNVSISEVQNFSIYFSNSCTGNCRGSISYVFEVEEGMLTDGEDVSIPLSTLQPLLNNLHTLYPRTRDLTHVSHTHDYPNALAEIILIDGRRVVINSSSQLNKLVPWNVTLWAEDDLGVQQVVASYLLLHNGVHQGFSAIWNQLEGKDFPRDFGDEGWNFLKTIYDEEPETLNLHLEGEWAGRSGAFGAQVLGIGPGVTEPFVNLLAHNDLLAALFDQGFSVFDLAFDVDMATTDPRPLNYRGMLALLAPNGSDVIATTVDIELEPEILVNTPLDKQEISRILNERASFAFLEEELPLVLPGVVYILETRSQDTLDFRASIKDFKCETEPKYQGIDYSLRALIRQDVPTEINLYRIDELDAWAIDLSLFAEEALWEDYAARVQELWLPEAFDQIDLNDLAGLSTDFLITFKPDVTDRKPHLITLLQTELPKNTIIHVEHPQKEGDQTFARFYGNLIVPEDGSEPYFIYCGQAVPDWGKRDPSPADAILPNPQTERSGKPLDITGSDWTTLEVTGGKSATRADFAISHAGYVHVFWADGASLFYSEGLVDGTQWLKPQRIGPKTSNIRVIANQRGDVHLFWDTLYPYGSVHIWRPSGGNWQPAERWDRGYYSNLVLEEDGRLHMGWEISDGFDTEFFYAYWTPQAGLSQPENVSRQLGEVGRTQFKIADDGTVHALWEHSFESDPFVDPLSGEIFDQLGLFYAKRLGENGWTLPELVGTFAPFSHAMSLELSQDNQPVAIWQNIEGIVSSTRSEGTWSIPFLLVDVQPPEEPDPYGPGRWVEATAQVHSVRDSDGNIYLMWSTKDGGLSLVRFVDQQWTLPELLTDEDIKIFNPLVDDDGDLHVAYTAEGLGYSRYLRYSNGSIVSQTNLGLRFGVSGNHFIKLLVDKDGYIYAMGVPSAARLRVSSIHENPPPVALPAFLATPTPTAAPPPPIPTTVSVTVPSNTSGELAFAFVIILGILALVFTFSYFISREEEL